MISTISSSRAVLAALLFLFAGFLNPVLAVTVRINALGDSITGSPGCWRATLWQMLQTAGITNTAFVGSLPAQGCGFPYDGANDGHGGALATGIANQDELPGWLAISQPDIVMMELGTNDVWSGLTPPVILAAFTTLVGQMRAQKPTMRILVAQITPMAPSNCPNCPQGVINLNAAIPAWAANISTAASPVSVVDCFTGYNDATDTVDGVHPNDSGNAKLANCWFTPLKNAIIAASGGATPTTPPASSTPVSSTSSKSPISSKLSTSTIKSSSSTTTSSTKTSTSSTATGAVQVEWGQCGGQGWTGPTACVSGAKCVYSNAWYSQCLPS